MTEKLKKAFRAASKLPPDRQDSFADFILAELESDARWDDDEGRSSSSLKSFDLSSDGRLP